MTFANPQALLLLLLLPVLVVVARRRAQPVAIGFPATITLAGVRPSATARLRQALPWLRVLILGLAVLALARPQWGIEVARIQREGIVIAMVIDTSSSMSAIDLRLDDQPSNRLDVVKATFRDFVGGTDAEPNGRDGDAIGMVTFARYASSLIPPTLDHEALLELLERVDIVESPIEDGTAIGDAILRTVDMLRSGEGASKVMILLTDGTYNVGEVEPLVAAQIAAALDIRIYTIGAGTRGIAQVPVPAADGTVEYRESQVSIDEDTLGQIAELTDGKYFRATEAAALRSIYGEIDQLEKARHSVERYQLRVEGFPVFVGLGLALLLLEIVLINTQLRTAP